MIFIQDWNYFTESQEVYRTDQHSLEEPIPCAGAVDLCTRSLCILTVGTLGWRCQSMQIFQTKGCKAVPLPVPVSGHALDIRFLGQSVSSIIWAAGVLLRSEKCTKLYLGTFYVRVWGVGCNLCEWFGIWYLLCSHAAAALGIAGWSHLIVYLTDLVTDLIGREGEGVWGHPQTDWQDSRTCMRITVNY